MRIGYNCAALPFTLSGSIVPQFAFKVSPKRSSANQAALSAQNLQSQVELALSNCSHAHCEVVWVQEFGSPRPELDTMLDAAKLSFLAMAISKLDDEREPGQVVPELFDKFWTLELIEGELLSAKESRSQLSQPVVSALARDGGFASRTLRKLASQPNQTPKRIRRFSLRTMFILMTMLGIGTALFAQWYLKYERRADAIQTLTDQGWSLRFEAEEYLQKRKSESLVEHIKVAIFGEAKTLVAVYARSPDDVTTLKPLQHLYDLRELDLAGTEKTDLDLRPLTQLKSLETLDISNTKFEDLSPLFKMESLNVLEARGIDRESLDVIAKLTNLKELNLRQCKAKALPSLKRMVKLETIQLRDSDFEDISGLDGMESLVELRVVNTKVTVAPSNLKRLKEFSAYRSQLSDASGLASCPELESVRIDHTKIDNLEWARNLKNLESIWFPNTPIDDLSPLTGKVNVRLDMSNTQVKDLSPLSGFTNIESFESPKVVENIDAIGTWPEFYEVRIDSPFVKRFPKLAVTSANKLEICCPQVSNLDALSSLKRIENLTIDGLAIDNINFLKNVWTDRLALRNMDVSDLSPITTGELKSLELVSLPVKSLDALPKLKTLEKLALIDLEVEDFSRLQDCFNLKDLSVNNIPKSQRKYFYNCDLVRLAVEDSELDNCDLTDGTSIQFLRLNNSKIKDYSHLSRQRHLTYLGLKNTSVTNIDFLARTTIEAIDLGGTMISDLSVLQNKGAFIGIDLSNTNGVDLAPLRGTRIKDQGSLFLRHTKGYDLEPLRGIEWLLALDLSFSDITDLTPLNNNTRVCRLDLAHTKIESIDGLLGGDLDELNIAHTNVSDISALETLQPYKVDLSYSQVRDLSPLYKCKYLNSVRIEGLPISDQELEELKSRLPLDCEVLRKESRRMDFYDEIETYLSDPY